MIKETLGIGMINPRGYGKDKIDMILICYLLCGYKRAVQRINVSNLPSAIFNDARIKPTIPKELINYIAMREVLEK